MGPPPNWFFSLTSFMGFLFCAIPFPWHLQAWNTGTCLYMFWTGLYNLNNFVNSIVWNSDVINRAPVWCDISAKFQIGGTVGIPAASLCINRRLYQIASVSTVTRTRAQKRRDVMIDLAIGFGIPIIQMILQYIVQCYRFMIFEEIGCYPYEINSIPTYPLVAIWPVAIGLVSAFYCIRTIRELAIRRAQFKELLSANQNLSSNRYFRLMGLAGIEVLCTVPLGSYVIYLNTTEGLTPWPGFAAAHAQISTIIQVPSAIWRSDPQELALMEMSRYFVVIGAFVFFAFFGFADEARKNYRLAYYSVAKRVGLSTGTMSSTGTWSPNGSSNVPVVITQRTEKRRDSISSFTTHMSLADYGGALDDLKKETFTPTATSSGSISKESLPTMPIDLDSVQLPSLPDIALETRERAHYSPSSANAV